MSAKGKGMRRSWVDPDDAPELTGGELSDPRTEWRINGKRVSPEKGITAFRDELLGKSRVNIHLDNAVIDHFKARAGDRGYQTLINATLRKIIDQEMQVDHVRGVIREELRRALGSKSSTAR